MTVVALMLALVAAQSPAPALDAAVVAKGRELFRVRCALCHGNGGKGDGPNARYLDARPRDLTSQPLRFSSPPDQPMGLSEALLRQTLRRGVPGTAMPRFAALPEDELGALVSFIRSLRPAGTPFVQDDSSEKRGRDVYAKLGCAKCHGASGAGDGPSARELKDEAGRFIGATDLRRPRTFRGGSAVQHVKRAILSGVPGTPMPAYSGALSDEELSALLSYLASIALQ